MPGQGYKPFGTPCCLLYCWVCSCPAGTPLAHPPHSDPAPTPRSPRPTASLPCSLGFFLSSCLPFLLLPPPGSATVVDPGATRARCPGVNLRKDTLPPSNPQFNPFRFQVDDYNHRWRLGRTLGLLAFFSGYSQPCQWPGPSTPAPSPARFSWVRAFHKKLGGELLAPAAGPPRSGLLSSNPHNRLQCSPTPTPPRLPLPLALGGQSRPFLTWPSPSLQAWWAPLQSLQAWNLLHFLSR